MHDIVYQIGHNISRKDDNQMNKHKIDLYNYRLLISSCGNKELGWYEDANIGKIHTSNRQQNHTFG